MFYIGLPCRNVKLQLIVLFWVCAASGNQLQQLSDTAMDFQHYHAGNNVTNNFKYCKHLI